MYQIMSSFFSALVEPADALLDPGKRVFAPFLIGSVVIAALVTLARGAGLRRTVRALGSRRIWLSRSALGDYQLIAVKALLRAALFGSFGLSMLVVAALLAGFLRRHFGLPGLHASPVLLAALYTLAAFLVEDWSRYALHKLMHRVPLLWDFHKVHHSAEVLTPFTLYRTHPVETFLNGLRGALAVGLVTGLFSWLFGPGLRAWEILGIEAIGFLWTLFGANLRHSHVWLSYGRVLEHLLVSPAQHQVHHSTDARHIDRNFGTVLAIWDWLGGSLYTTTRRRERLAMGLPPGEEPIGHNVLALLVKPFLSSLRRLTAPVARPVPRRHSRSLRSRKEGRRRAVAAALVVAALFASGCGDTPKKVDRGELLTALATCTVDRYKQALAAADALATDTSRANWERAIDAWQVADLLRYGPLAGFDTTGGKGLREPIYSWPDVNRCLTDEQLVSRAYEAGGLAQLSTATRGLAAIEYLLFHAGTDNGCPAANAINATGTWAAIPPAELAARKAAYAKAAATDVAARIRELIAAWEPNGFAAQLATAGKGSTLFVTQQLALSAAGEAIFYFDTDMKDPKLGMQLGVVACPAEGCPAFESPWAERGKLHLQNNLAGVETLLLGCPAGGSLGFLDLLESIGAPMLATQAREDLAAAHAAFDAIPGAGLKQPFMSDRPSVQRLFDAIKELTDFLKMEFKTALQLSATRVEGDHD